MFERLQRVIDAQVDLGRFNRRYPPELYPPSVTTYGQCVEPRIVIDGCEFLQFNSLDYLGLATDGRVIEAGVEAMRKYGVGALPSRIADGSLDVHRELEATVADYMKADDAVVFTAGMFANIGSIPAILASHLPRLVGRPPRRTKKAYFADRLCHESFRIAREVVKARGVATLTFNHNDMGHLDHLMVRHEADLMAVLVDGVYSMDGDVADLNGLVEICEDHGAILYVDDAHGVGVQGEEGRGVCELRGVEDRVDIRMGVLSKAFGVLGGFVVGPPWFMRWLRLCETQMFTMAIPAAESASTTAAIRIAQAEPWRRQRVKELANYMRGRLQDIGYDTLASTTHIVPVLLGDELYAREVSAFLRSRGILAPCLEAPASPPGMARLRLFPSARHTVEDCDTFLDAMGEVATWKTVPSVNHVQEREVALV